jgi:hypothetical protein
MVFAAVAAATAAGAPAFPAAAKSPAPFASFRLGDATAEFDRKGGFVMKRGSEVLVSGADLVVAQPGWRGTSAQSGARAVEGWPSPSCAVGARLRELSAQNVRPASR